MATVNSVKALGRLVIVKATQKTSQTTDTGMCDPGFELKLFWKSNKDLISLQGQFSYFLLIFITRFSGN